MAKIKYITKGNYTAKITFNENDKFKASETSTTFNVYEKVMLDPNLTISVNDIKEDKTAIIELHADNGFEGTVFISVKDIYTTAYVKDGYGKVCIDNLSPGNYTVVAKYLGDGKYNEWNGSANFKVLSLDNLKLKMDVEQIFDMDWKRFHPYINGDYIKIDIQTDEKFNGPINVEIGDSEYTVNVKNGHGSSSIYMGPVQGKYIAKAKFEGNDQFKKSTYLTEFEMTQF